MKNKKLSKAIKFVVGIDEVGRGPLAGPVAVCAFKMPINFRTNKFGKLKDSKKLTEDKREEIFEKLKEVKNRGVVDYFVSYESAQKIDNIGISKAIKNCLEKSLNKLKLEPNSCLILLDGGLKAPEIYKYQKTIIKGDEKERSIAFASIVAKVSRDSLMYKFSKKYPKYFFDLHKGYGTKKHCEAIVKNGLSSLHRKSFCKSFLFDSFNK